MWFCIVGIVAFAVFVISKMLFPNWMKDHPWVGATAIFIDIGMLIGIGHMNPLVTAIILMTIVAFIALWSVLCVIGIHGDGRTIKSLELDQFRCSVFFLLNLQMWNEQSTTLEKSIRDTVKWQSFRWLWLFSLIWERLFLEIW